MINWCFNAEHTYDTCLIKRFLNMKKNIGNNIKN